MPVQLHHKWPPSIPRWHWTHTAGDSITRRPRGSGPAEKCTTAQRTGLRRAKYAVKNRRLQSRLNAIYPLMRSLSLHGIQTEMKVAMDLLLPLYCYFLPFNNASRCRFKPPYKECLQLFQLKRTTSRQERAGVCSQIHISHLATMIRLLIGLESLHGTIRDLIKGKTSEFRHGHLQILGFCVKRKMWYCTVGSVTRNQLQSSRIASFLFSP